MEASRRQFAAAPAAAVAVASEPRMVRIPEGWFTMGCDTGRDDEKPARRVWVDAFELGVCQVTRAEYGRFLAATQHTAPPFWHDPHFQDPRQPVAGPSWHDAVAYCEWLSGAGERVRAVLAARSDKKRYRLPTEAEWERAARGGAEGALYPWGDAAPETLPDYSRRWTDGPEPVALYAPNAYGLFNMCDNMHEWCADWYDARSYPSAASRNPRGPEHGTRRASRGGSWRHHIKVSRCAARSSIPPEFKYADYGFRVAR